MSSLKYLLIGALFSIGGATPPAALADNATVDITGTYNSLITTKRGKRRHVVPGYYTKVVTDMAMDWLRQRKGKQPSDHAPVMAEFD